eukprot:8028681-Prorocentrum_lima.AAC.1
MKRPTVTSRTQRSGHQMKDCCKLSNLYNATVGAQMPQPKAAGLILPGCGHGSLLLELLLVLPL